MALAGDMLREFIVGIAFEINKASQTAAISAVDQIKDAGKRHVDQERRNTQDLDREHKRRAEDLEGSARRMGAALNNHLTNTLRNLTSAVAGVAGAVAGVRAVQSFVVDMGQLADLSKKTSSAASDIKAIAESFQGLGSTRGAAVQAVEGIFSAIQQNRGTLSALRALGVTETKNTTLQLEQLSKGLRQVVQQYGMDVAIMRAGQVGINEEAVRVLTDPKFESELARTRKIHEAWRGNADADAAAGRELLRQWALLSVQAGIVRDNLTTKLITSVTPFIGSLNRQLEQNAGAISKALDGLAHSVAGWAEQNAQSILNWVTELLDPANSAKRDEWTEWFNNIKFSVSMINDALAGTMGLIKEIKQPTGGLAELFKSIADTIATTKQEFEGIVKLYNFIAGGVNKINSAEAAENERRAMEATTPSRPSLLRWWQGPGGIPDEDKVRGRSAYQNYGPNIDEMKVKEANDKFSKGAETLDKAAGKLEKATEGQGWMASLSKAGQGLLNALGLGSGGSGPPGGFIGQGSGSGGSGGGGSGGGGTGGGGTEGGEAAEGGSSGGARSRSIRRGGQSGARGGAMGTRWNPRGSDTPGRFRPAYNLGPRDVSDAVVNTIAGEAVTSNPESVDAVINNMMNRVGSKGWGPSGNLEQVARAPGQYAGYRRANPAEAERIRDRIRAIASGGVPDNTAGANTYRAAWYGTGGSSPWFNRIGRTGRVVGGNRFAYDPSVSNGPYAPFNRGDIDKVVKDVQKTIDDPVKREAAKYSRPRLGGDKIQNLIEDNAKRLDSGSDGKSAPGPLSSNTTSNDNSVQVSQNNNYNTTIHAADASGANSLFRRSMEVQAGMALGQAKTALR
jgi:uncharacterized membrane protein YgcG